MNQVVSRAQWIEARKDLLAKEKEFTRARDALNRERRALPWVHINKHYLFEGADGQVALPQLFAGKSQLIVYHFMFDPDWQAGCKSCSFWADHFDGIIVHLAHRDVSMVAVSRAPFATLAGYRRRMGWRFPWFSSAGSGFNYDFHVSHSAADIATGQIDYNYCKQKPYGTEMPGVSVFARDGDTVFHTYSCYARGLDMLNGAYHHLDLVPRGRDEEALPYSMAWLCRHDEYVD